MILKRLMVGPIQANCYIFGSEITKETVIIDPGGDANTIIRTVEDLGVSPKAVLITHGHYDHSLDVGKIIEKYQIPLMYCKKEYESGIFNRIQANRWLSEGDTIEVGDITIHVLETPGHSPGSLCYFTTDIKEFNGNKIDGLIFTGDLLFRGSIGRSDLGGGNPNVLFASIKEKIMYNKSITDKFLVLPGHMGPSSVGDERNFNMFREYFT